MMMSEILNSGAIDEFCWKHRYNGTHAIKNKDGINIAWVDWVLGKSIAVEYDTEADLQAIQAELEERFKQILEARLLEQREACAKNVYDIFYDLNKESFGYTQLKGAILNATIEEG